jgi:hypothetical protein
MTGISLQILTRRVILFDECYPYHLCQYQNIKTSSYPLKGDVRHIGTPALRFYIKPAITAEKLTLPITN